MQAGDLLDSKAKNWPAWSKSMHLLFKLLKVKDYIYGTIPCPDAGEDPVGADNWEYNDTYAQMLINSKSLMQKSCILAVLPLYIVCGLICNPCMNTQTVLS